MSEAAVETPALHSAGEFEIGIEQVEDFEFRVRFDQSHHPDLFLDEPEPLGRNAGPNPSRILAAAVGDCLSASLLFCARRAHVDLGRISTNVHVQLCRNDRGRLRIGKVDVTIDPHLPESDRASAARCLSMFEDFCVVTQSVRAGIDVDVSVKGLSG
jgi:organic hydroperoxide reductase OsmC/OhrA